jgi:hypothetical protein
VSDGGAGDPPAAVLLADPVGDRHPDVVEEDLGEVGAAGEVAQRADGDPGRVRVDEQVRSASRARCPRSRVAIGVWRRRR